MTLRELLCAQPLSADVWDDRLAVHFEGISLGDEDVEWDHGNHKSAEMEVAPPDNMRLWRLRGVAIGRWMGLLRRASERVYAPGGTGVEEMMRREFEAFSRQQT